MNEVSAAHKTLPLPSFVEVTNLQNGRTLLIRLNDRGPFVDGRIVDLSRRAAELLDIHTKGVERVRVRRVYPAGRPEVAALPPPVRIASDLPAGETPQAQPSGRIEQASLPPPSARQAPSTSAAKPAPTPPVELGTVYVQVAAVSDLARAEALIEQVGRYGSTTIERIAGAGGPLFRVRIGPFATKSEAEPILLEVQQVGYPDARIFTASLGPSQSSPIG
jgi:rare lipoprotein A